MGRLNQYLEAIDEKKISQNQLNKIANAFFRTSRSHDYNVGRFLKNWRFTEAEKIANGVIGKGEDAYHAMTFKAKYGKQTIYGIYSEEPGVFELSLKPIKFSDYD